ncbi:hypothetical protein SAMN05216174_111220 [Actinokineospora iranica]|uniref:Uncharacterized protein n=1 Tax=Actinokineospora iranica TaxID=1271860 RepID=A0A1G6V4Z3_9PSEU|nr:hypothetical protein SAMN05216174_111220 [Actinokineospora iranica]
MGPWEILILLTLAGAITAVVLAVRSNNKTKRLRQGIPPGHFPPSYPPQGYPPAGPRDAQPR